MGEAALPLARPRTRAGALRLLGDDRLAKMAAAGNRNAFAAIYERHHQALYRYCRSILGRDEDARDALQNTMLKALGALPGEKRKIALRPWLFRVAHNEAISLVRRRPEAEALDEASAPSSEFDPATRERLRTLLADMAALPDRQRGALVMRELNGLSYGDIASALDTSPAAAKQAVYEARLTLHELTEGREMECEQAREAISVRDGRVLRARKLRAHLRSCLSCRAFRASLGDRSADLALLAPPLPAAAAAGLLHGLLGGGGGGSGGGLAGVAGGVGGQSLVGTAGIKAVTAAAVVVAGAGAVDVATNAAGIPNLGGDGVSLESGQSSNVTDRASGRSGGGGDLPVGGRESSGKETAGGSSSHSGEPPGNSGSAPGHTGTAPGQAGTSPGRAGTTPGQSGTAPGRSGATPGHGGSPPGQTGTSPGRAGTTPGQSGTTPGNSGAAPGRGGTPPGQGGTPPGRS